MRSAWRVRIHAVLCYVFEATKHLPHPTHFSISAFHYRLVQQLPSSAEKASRHSYRSKQITIKTSISAVTMVFEAIEPKRKIERDRKIWEPIKARAAIARARTWRVEVAKRAKASSTPRDEKAGAAAEQTNAKSPFLSLPQELRDIIYEHVILERKLDPPGVWPDVKDDTDHPKLAAACRQLRREVLPLYYNLSRFYFKPSETPSQFFTENLYRMGEIHLGACKHGNFRLTSAHSLSTCQINIHPYPGWSPAWADDLLGDASCTLNGSNLILCREYLRECVKSAPEGPVLTVDILYGIFEVMEKRD